MGCIERKKIVFRTKAGQTKKILGIGIVVAMLITSITPIVFAGPQEIAVSFDPSGTVDLDVSPLTANFSTATFESYTDTQEEGSGATDHYTCWNNGTIGADVYIFSNTTTDGGSMTLDAAGWPPALNEYVLNVTGSEAIRIPNVNGTIWEDNLAADASITFGFNLALGPGSQDWGWQYTQINITAVVNS